MSWLLVHHLGYFRQVAAPTHKVTLTLALVLLPAILPVECHGVLHSQTRQQHKYVCTYVHS